MARFRTLSTLQRAHAVLAIAELLIDDDWDINHDIFVGSYHSGTTSGLHLTSFLGDRQCNLAGASSSDGVLVCVGTRQDFDYNSGQAKDSATRIDFGHNEFHLAARAVVDWLCFGDLPEGIEHDSSDANLAD